MSSRYVIEVNDDDFDTVVLQSKVPVVVDFWAPWCGPCVHFAPVLENIAQTVAQETGKQAPDIIIVKFAKLNIDDNPVTAKKFNIHSIPTIIVFKDGAITARAIGPTQGFDIIQELLESFS